MLDKIVAMLGASPVQYRLLLKTEKLVEKRALEGRNDLSNMSLAVTCVVGFILSVLFTFMPFILSMDTFTFSLIGITMSMTMISLWIFPYFDILLAPINYPVIAHTPVSSRTYFLAKLTQVLTYTVLLLGSMNLMPAIGGIWVHKGEFSLLRLLFPIVYVPIVFMSGFFTIGVMTVFAGYLTRLYSKRLLRSIAQYAQFIFPALFPVALILLSRLIPYIPGRAIGFGAEMAPRASERLVRRNCLAYAWRNRTAFLDFSRTGCRFNPVFGIRSASEYRKALFNIPLLSLGVRESAKG